MTYIPDPIELLDAKAESLADAYIDEHACMQCNKRVDYELIQPDPLGYGPLLCQECYKPEE